MANNYTNIGKVTLNRKLNKILDELRMDMAKKPSIADAIQVLIDGLEKMKNGKEEPRIKPLALYLEILEMIREKTQHSDTYERKGSAHFIGHLAYGYGPGHIRGTAHILSAAVHQIHAFGFYHGKVLRRGFIVHHCGIGAVSAYRVKRKFNKALYFGTHAVDLKSG